MAYCSLLPVFIVVGLATLIIFKREIHCIIFLFGILTNEVTNICLKNLIKEPRPNAGHYNVHSEYGQPSNHSQFIGFFSSFCFLFLVVRINMDTFNKTIYYFFVLTPAFLVSYSRFYLLYHSWQQVLFGNLVGIFMALIWFMITHFGIVPYILPVTGEFKLFRILMLQNSNLKPFINFALMQKLN